MDQDLERPLDQGSTHNERSASINSQCVVLLRVRLQLVKRIPFRFAKPLIVCTRATMPALLVFVSRMD